MAVNIKYLVTETEQAKSRKYSLGFGEQYSISRAYKMSREIIQ